MQPRYLHSTDSELRIGDVILPAVLRQHTSRWRAVPGYDPSLVYMHDSHSQWYDPTAHDVHGSFTYGVEPLGEVGPDPEVEHWKRYWPGHPAEAEEEFGVEPGEWHESTLGSALSSCTAAAARVVTVEHGHPPG